MIPLLNTSDKSTVNTEDKRQSYLEKISLLKGRVTTQALITQIKNRQRILVEDESRLDNEYLQRAINFNPAMICAICVSTKTAYNLDMVNFFELGVSPYCQVHPILFEQIMTTCQEAYANAILWSNLELWSAEGEVRSLEFDRQIQQRLKQHRFHKRSIVLLLSRRGSYLELAISVEGKPIVWPEGSEKSQKFRGVSIIKALTDRIEFSDYNQTLKMLYRAPQFGVAND